MLSLSKVAGWSVDREEGCGDGWRWSFASWCALWSRRSTMSVEELDALFGGRVGGSGGRYGLVDAGAAAPDGGRTPRRRPRMVLQQ